MCGCGARVVWAWAGSMLQTRDQQNVFFFYLFVWLVFPLFVCVLQTATVREYTFRPADGWFLWDVCVCVSVFAGGGTCGGHYEMLAMQHTRGGSDTER